MKYKLIKEYPGSPKLRTELTPKVDLENNNTNNYYWEGSWFNPKDFNEFWELVVEKDYEILSFKNIDNDLIYDEYQGVYRNETSTRPIGYCLEFYKIHSIKRISDGEIFTIGDKITGKSKCNCTINNIELNPNCNQIMFNRLDEGIDLINAKRIKQPLFTTEDGVDIFEGDTFYYVKFVQYNNTLGEPFEVIRGNYPSFTYEPQYEKYFSTKEKAEEYIIMNKPCLSINDVARIYRGLNKTNGNPSTQANRLKELAKSKI